MKTEEIDKALFSNSMWYSPSWGQYRKDGRFRMYSRAEASSATGISEEDLRLFEIEQDAEYNAEV